MMGKVPKNIVSVSLSHGLFSHFDLLTFEDGTDTLPQNVGKELSLWAV
jgi:hypothetical protein